MTDGLIGFSTEATKGSFKSVRKVSGIIESYERVPAPASFKGFPDKNGVVQAPADQLKVVLLDPVFLEMANGEDEPELKDGKYTIYMNYAKPGKNPSFGSIFVQGFVKSAEALWIGRGESKVENDKTVATKSYLDLQGQLVTLKWLVDGIELPDFSKKDENAAPTPPKKYSGWVFIENEDEVDNDTDYIKNLLIGNNLSSAKRLLLTDTRARRDDRWKKALDAGTLGDMLGLELDATGKFAEAVAV
ncbi:MAG: hypothetical protein TUN42_04180 [Dehalogenimonas sp.]